MTKKHFEAMASKFKGLLDAADSTENPECYAGIAMSVHAFCRVAADINPRFDESRFCRACGLEG